MNLREFKDSLLVTRRMHKLMLKNHGADATQLTPLEFCKVEDEIGKIEEYLKLLFRISELGFYLAQYSSKGLVRVYPTIRDAALYLQVHENLIKAVLNNDQKKFANCYWRYIEDYPTIEADFIS